MNSLLASRFIIAGLAAFLTFMVFLPALQNEFVNWDDNLYVYENPFIRSLDTQLLKSSWGEFHAYNWHPLTWLSHALDYAVWGMNPLGHHLTNILLHAINTFLVVVLVVKLLASWQASKLTDPKDSHAVDYPLFAAHYSSLIVAGVTGLLFGIHPIHVESVAWVAERKDLLCALFYLLSVMMYVKYATTPLQRAESSALCPLRSRSLFFALCFFVLALVSKPMAVSLPLVLLILDWYPFRKITSLKTFWAAFLQKLPFLALSLISAILTIVAQKTGGTMEQMQSVPLWARLLVAAKSLIAYLWKMMVPIDLIPFYPYPEKISLLSLEYIVPIGFVTGITATCIALMRTQKLWMSVWSYYVITLAPVLGIVQAGIQSMADRYTYLPSIGPFLIVGFMAARGYARVTSFAWGRVMLPLAGLFISLALVISMSYATLRQIGVWKDSVALWNYVIEKKPSCVPFAHYNLAIAYMSRGLLDLAIPQFQEALRLKPAYAEAHSNLAVAYESQGLSDRAIEQYKMVLSLKPGYAEAHFNLGRIYLMNGSIDLARTEFESGLRDKPDDYRARQVLNSILSR